MATQPKRKATKKAKSQPLSERPAFPPIPKWLTETQTETLPVACPKCGAAANAFKPVEGAESVERIQSGRLQSGFDYTLVKWYRVRCFCGQCLMARDYIADRKFGDYLPDSYCGQNRGLEFAKLDDDYLGASDE